MWAMLLPLLEKGAEYIWTNRLEIIAGIQKYGPQVAAFIQTNGPVIEAKIAQYEPAIKEELERGTTIGAAVLKAVVHDFGFRLPTREEEEREFQKASGGGY